MSAPRILLVEDEAGLVMTLTDRLTGEGYAVESRGDGESGLQEALAQPYDLLLLDVMLPRKSGLDVCRKLREAGVVSPILMLTARGQLVDKVVGLKTGADDYLTKPFEMMELLARIEALLRRVPRPAAGALAAFRFGDVTIDFRASEVSRAGQTIPLSAREFQLLRYLVEHRGQTISRDQLLRDVWGYDAATLTRTVDVHMAWLRQKLEPNSKHPEFFLTLRGLGYRFNG
jgi:two-component system, OmpR family, alkaline phosphatase synthesis response regulator PhoP